MVDVAGTGFTTLDRVYTNNVKTSEALGGSCGNVLISLAMLDRSVVPLLSLGDDLVGSYLIDELIQAGADTRYITRRMNFASPILAQQLDLESGQHSFSFVCPETNEALPRYQPVLDEDVEVAKSVLDACAVFYTDRLTHSILHAMETAAASGALIFFEPSGIDDKDLFNRAVRLCSVLKYSSERLSSEVLNCSLRAETVSIVTHGAKGLEISSHEDRRWCSAIPAAMVRDTCGAGDMLTVGIIDWILGNNRPKADLLTLDYFLFGVTAGQRLAAVNCAFAGARGIFKQHGARGARLILDGVVEDYFVQADLFEAERSLS